MSDDRLAGIETKLDALTSGQERIEGRLGGLESRLDKLEVGQEQMADNIKQVAEGHDAVIAAIRSGVRTVCAHTDERIRPLEAAVRKSL